MDKKKKVLEILMEKVKKLMKKLLVVKLVVLENSQTIFRQKQFWNGKTVKKI